ncbi:MAG: helix-turn-helix domain-containing protein [Acutalibacteraceae bacterium]
MDNKKTGELILKLRTEKGLTQKQLADMLTVSDKAVSKWERGQGLPDISLFPSLSRIFGVNIEGLLGGGLESNSFAAGNMKKTKFYVCPICGNITVCTGEAEITCCSRKISEAVPKKADIAHTLDISAVEDEWFITSAHEMKKEHYISFIAFATDDRLQIIKQYPEWNLSVRIPVLRHGVLLWYCTGDGLFYKNI